MSAPEKIYFNGRLLEQTISLPGINPLPSENYIYAAINTFEHRPLYLGMQLKYAFRSYEKLYGISPGYDTEHTRQQIGKLLDENRMPRLGNIVRIYLLPPRTVSEVSTPDTLITVSHHTIYRGYELISIRPRAVLVNYEIPFSGHRTAVSLAASSYMQSFAERAGCHTALHTDRAEKLVSCGDYPVFLAKDGVLFTPPPEIFPPCAELELMRRACSLAGLEVAERSFSASELPGADEIMVLNHTGLLSILSLGSYYFYNLLALRIEKALRTVTAEGFGM